ncbi:expressed unknown protein (Partial), partial [Seminavis robusta]
SPEQQGGGGRGRSRHKRVDTDGPHRRSRSFTNFMGSALSMGAITSTSTTTTTETSTAAPRSRRSRSSTRLGPKMRQSLVEQLQLQPPPQGKQDALPSTGTKRTCSVGVLPDIYKPSFYYDSDDEDDDLVVAPEERLDEFSRQVQQDVTNMTINISCWSSPPQAA